MARATGVSKDTVQRLWRANDIKPHVTRTFKLSTDPHFEEKFWDVLGLYLDPPARSLVLCCDQKSQCQALERSQPGFPVMRGYSRTRTRAEIRGWRRCWGSCGLWRRVRGSDDGGATSPPGGRKREGP